MLPGLVAFSFFDTTRNFLYSLGRSTVVMWIQLMCTVLHYLWCYLFVNKFQLDIKGTALATTLTYFLNFIVTTLYVSTIKELRPAWFLPNRNSFRGLCEYLKLGIPTVTIMLVDWSSFEIMTLIAGYISMTAQGA